MSAPTIAVEWLLARAAMRASGLLHVVSRRSSGALNPICGARTISSEKIDMQYRLEDATHLCDGCATIAASFGGTVVDGVALILGLSAATTTTRLLDVPVTSIDLAPSHARRTPGAVDDLVDSVIERGIVTPVLLRRTGNRFEVIDGGRRIYAAHKAGLELIPAIVKDATEGDALIDALTANLHREDLNPIELAHAYQHAIDTLGLKSKAELGRLLGISREAISNTIRLLSLSEEDQQRIADGDLTAEGGRKLLAAPKAPAAKLDDVAGLLAQLLAAKVNVTASGGRTRIVIDVADADRDRVLGRLGETAVAA